ncbi:MAG: S-layer homology domain-containing protein [Acidimicrobiaceae bacterium]|nr:S-layer homology domain-containing protein [Acidimicrobiaceae bacterium]
MARLFRAQRSGWAVLVVGALVASVLAVGSGAANAAFDKQDYKPSFQACVGPATDDKGFTDVSAGHAHRTAINCLAYYGVSLGTGDGTTFSPEGTVKRYEMAAFLGRALKAAIGEENLPDVTDQGFTDIDDAPPFAQDWINRLADLEIIEKGSQFRPRVDVTRAQMAVWLVNFLDEASDAVDIATNGDITLTVRDESGIADDYFHDTRIDSPAAVDKAASALYELGVVNGKSVAPIATPDQAPLDYYYEPFDTVNRGQMAAFITRALAHTSARPTGVTLQYNGTLDDEQLLVSLRDSSFQPATYKPVDVFWTTIDDVADAFEEDDGTCNDEVLKEGLGAGDTGTNPVEADCEIESSNDTGFDGDVKQDFTADKDGVTLWAWTGEAGDTVKSSTKLYPLNIPASEITRKATKAVVDSNHDADLVFHYGTNVRYTIQLEDEDGSVSYGTDGEEAASWTLRVSTYRYADIPFDHDGDGGTTPVTAYRAACKRDGTTSTYNYALNPDDCGTGYTADADAPAISVRDYDLTTSRGVTPFIITASDPGSGTAGTTAVQYELIPGSNAPTSITNDAQEKETGENYYQVRFSDKDSDLSRARVTVDVDRPYLTVEDESVDNRVFVRVTDQYGDPLRNDNARVVLFSDIIGTGTGDDASFDDEEFNPAIVQHHALATDVPAALTAALTDANSRSLRRSNVVRYVFSSGEQAESATGSLQNLYAQLYEDATPSVSSDAWTLRVSSPETVKVHIALPAADTTNSTTSGVGASGQIVQVDTDRSIIIFENASDDDYRWIRYDNNDWFQIAPKAIYSDSIPGNGDDNNDDDALGLQSSTTVEAKTLSEFEEALSVFLRLDSTHIVDAAADATSADAAGKIVTADQPTLEYYSYENGKTSKITRIVVHGGTS